MAKWGIGRYSLRDSVKNYRNIAKTSRRVVSGIWLSAGLTAIRAQTKVEEQFGELFKEVQLKHIFDDSKTFPDCVPRYPPTIIMANYHKQRGRPGFDLETFVRKYFIVPAWPSDIYQSDPTRPAEEHINKLWPVLTRQPKRPIGSLIPLIKPYIVPGGRFSEIYYWDSYFTMLGLQAAGDVEMVQNMVDNFAYLIRKLGFIPNGNRTYFSSRSQPPYFSMMIGMLSEMKGKRVLITYLPYLEEEYKFWMADKEKLKDDFTASRRVVRLADGVILNRFWDDKDTPRPESYREDVELAQGHPNPAELYRHIRAGAESGWDYSSRWLRDGQSMRTIHTTDIVPIDLNCLLFRLETMIAEAYRLKGEKQPAMLYLKRAQRRQRAIHQYFWDARKGFFFDYDFRERQHTPVYSLAAASALHLKLASEGQAARVAEHLERDFLKPGGLSATLHQTGQQWDAPNGWAPLQWISIWGLRHYGYYDLAERIKKRWIEENLLTYRTKGKLVEKYDVFDRNAEAGGGEYVLQDGFGWTNGVLLALLKEGERR